MTTVHFIGFQPPNWQQFSIRDRWCRQTIIIVILSYLCPINNTLPNDLQFTRRLIARRSHDDKKVLEKYHLCTTVNKRKQSWTAGVWLDKGGYQYRWMNEPHYRGFIYVIWYCYKFTLCTPLKISIAGHLLCFFDFILYGWRMIQWAKTV